MIEYRPIGRDHLDGVIELCRIEEYPSFLKDRELSWRALTAPGVTTIVAVEGSEVRGFAQMQSDGLIQAHLSNIVVARGARRRGIGQRLIEEAFARAGGLRVDLVATELGEKLYQSFAYQRMPGYRIYPRPVEPLP